MNESFSTTSTSTASISSFSTGAAAAANGKVVPLPPPTGEPDDNWTVEELLRWSLEQYRSKVIEQTSSSIASLRAQCEKECEDVMKLHEVAVETVSNNNNNNTKLPGNASASSKNNNNTRWREEENRNPQVGDNAQQRSTTTTGTTNTATTMPASTTGDNAGASKSKAAATIVTAAMISDTVGTITTINSNSTASSSSDPIASGTIEITITSGPHSTATYTLHPTIGAPCLVGRSKGKKFVTNGISLFKDQEVSTTHGKVIVEEEEEEEKKEYSTTRMNSPRLLFYFVDVGSTNGTFYNGIALEPHQRLLLENDMELRVGNSVLKIVLG